MISSGRFDAVGRDHLRRYPALAHGRQYAGIVMRDELVCDLTVDGQRVQVTLVPLDEFLDGYGHAVRQAGFHDDLLQFVRIADFPRS